MGRLRVPRVRVSGFLPDRSSTVLRVALSRSRDGRNVAVQVDEKIERCRFDLDGDFLGVKVDSRSRRHYPHIPKSYPPTYPTIYPGI